MTALTPRSAFILGGEQRKAACPFGQVAIRDWERARRRHARRRLVDQFFFFLLSFPLEDESSPWYRSLTLNCVASNSTSLCFSPFAWM